MRILELADYDTEGDVGYVVKFVSRFKHLHTLELQHKQSPCEILSLLKEGQVDHVVFSLPNVRDETRQVFQELCRIKVKAISILG